MGLFRKLTSTATLGAVDFRSDKERIARNTKAAAKEAKRANVIAAESARLMAATAATAHQEATLSLTAELERLAALRDSGAITAEEFEAAKARLLM